MTTRDQPSARFEEIDFLRFLAAMSVVLFHFCFRHWNLDGSGALEFGLVSRVSQYGYLGVDVFFLISGFVISYSASAQSVRSFARSRAARLFPAYWFAAVVIYAFASWWPVPNYTVSPFDLAFNLSMLQGYFDRPNVSTVFWTLVIELNFYLIIGAVIGVGAMRHLLWLLWGWILVAVASTYLVLPRWFNFVLITDWAHYFIAGAGCFLIRLHGPSPARLALVAVCFVVAVRRANWYMLLKERLTGVDHDLSVVVAVLLTAFAIFLVMALVDRRIGFGKLAALGILTYPLYLIHSTIGHALIDAWHPVVGLGASVILVILLMLFVAYAIHRWVERPGSALIKRLMG